jgi:hypothetical protein
MTMTDEQKAQARLAAAKLVAEDRLSDIAAVGDSLTGATTYYKDGTVSHGKP